MSRPTKHPNLQWNGQGRGITMDTAPVGGHFLNRGALFSAVGGVRVCQLALGSAIISLIVHYTGHTGAPYGWMCMAVWSFSLAASLLIFVLDVTRLHTCLSFSWGDLAATHAATATVLQSVASVLYSIYFLVPGCSWGTCGVWRYRVGVAVCSCACCLAYAAEVLLLSRATNQGRPPYMATPPGLLKVVQACAAGVIFGALANSDYSRHIPAQYCVGVYSVCFVATVLVIGLTVTGRTGTSAQTVIGTVSTKPQLPFDHAMAIYTFLATLLYLSAAVVWPVFCFDRKYGAPSRPSGCPRWGGRGRCPWDAQLVVSIFTCVNLLFYLADLAYSHRSRPQSQHPLLLV